MRHTPPLVIAHRGASQVAPENTLPAFRRAIAMGAGMIELDVQRSADGALVVIHDDDTLRVAGGAGGPVAALSLAELRRLDLGGASIPTLDEVLALVRDAGISVNVELKAPGIEADTVAAVQASGLRDAALLSSFDREALARVRALDPAMRLAVLMGTDMYHPLVRLREAYPLPILRRLGAVAWHPHYRLLNRAIVRAVHRAGYRVHVWTVNQPAMMRRMLRLGVDGIITDEPDTLSALLDREYPT
jgi:glycerophosphoryl diester phosphodiesterase